jgi:hypothetical protein
MKIAILNDTHCGVRKSADTFIKYQERFYTEIFFPYLKKYRIKHILHLGDYYDDRKSLNIKATRENRKHFLDVLIKDKIKMDVILGNHDVFYKNTNAVNSITELLNFYPDNIRIIEEPTVVEYESLKMALIPWINNQNYHETLKFIDSCGTDWMAGHFEFSGFEMSKGNMNHHGMEVTPSFSRFESILSGHFHTKSSKGNIHYLGAQMEFTQIDCNDQKYFHILDTETRELEAIKNPLTIFQTIMYDDTKMNYLKEFYVSTVKQKFVRLIVVNKTDQSKLDAFVTKLQESELYELKIDETFNEFRGENVSDENIIIEDTGTLLDTYVDSVETDLDKEKIKTVMRELYAQACNEELT